MDIWLVGSVDVRRLVFALNQIITRELTHAARMRAEML